MHLSWFSCPSFVRGQSQGQGTRTMTIVCWLLTAQGWLSVPPDTLTGKGNQASNLPQGRAAHSWEQNTAYQKFWCFQIMLITWFRLKGKTIRMYFLFLNNFQIPLPNLSMDQIWTAVTTKCYFWAIETVILKGIYVSLVILHCYYSHERKSDV